MGGHDQFGAPTLERPHSMSDCLDGRGSETTSLVPRVDCDMTQLAAATAVRESQDADDGTHAVTEEKRFPTPVVRLHETLCQDNERHRLAIGDERNLIIVDAHLECFPPVARIDELEIDHGQLSS